MKKLIFLLVIVALVFIVWNRERLYIRDPLGKVMRDGVKEDGAQVFINYSNDVLLENDHAPMYVELVQHGQRMGVPVALRCMHFVVCLADADVATLVVNDGERVESMDGKQVVFHDAVGRASVVTLH